MLYLPAFLQLKSSYFFRVSQKNIGKCIFAYPHIFTQGEYWTYSQFLFHWICGGKKKLLSFY